MADLEVDGLVQEIVAAGITGLEPIILIYLGKGVKRGWKALWGKIGEEAGKDSYEAIKGVTKRAHVEVKEGTPQDEGPVFTAELPPDLPEIAVIALRSVSRVPPRRVRWDSEDQRWVDVTSAPIKGDDGF